VVFYRSLHSVTSFGLASTNNDDRRALVIDLDLSPCVSRGFLYGAVAVLAPVVVADQVTEFIGLVQTLGPGVGLEMLYVPAQLCPAQSAMILRVSELPGLPCSVNSQWPFVIRGAGKVTERDCGPVPHRSCEVMNSTAPAGPTPPGIAGDGLS
jgi:hypothetical protein